MKEQSHKREMAAALRGDFARLRERGATASTVVEATGDRDDSGTDRPEKARVARSVVRRLFRTG